MIKSVVSHAALSMLVATALLATNASAQSQGDPAIDYILQCQGCHLESGLGTPDIGVPSIVGLAERFLEVPGGRAYLVQVPGVSQAPLDDRAVARLMNWVFTRYSGAQTASTFEPYSAAEVAEYRTALPIDVVATRARLIREANGVPKSK